MMKKVTPAARYLRFCQSDFWRQVFAAELDYLQQHLRPSNKILSIGCGPATIEAGLSELGFNVVGLDVSQEALACAPDTLRTVMAPAEAMPLPDASFDVTLFIVSLQFIENYPQAISEATRVLKPTGRIIAMLLNPAANFFQEKYADPDSYVRKIKHTDLRILESAMSNEFAVQGEFFLGIAGDRVFPSSAPESAALYILQGTRR